jgi:hypothetical protein
MRVPDATELVAIDSGMANTYNMRKSDRNKGSSIKEILFKYPHLASYGGKQVNLSLSVILNPSILFVYTISLNFVTFKFFS